jgi:biopolymer transport protein ExbD
MDLKGKQKVDATFSMSSMTDIIFLLLIFFMLTSSFITPSGLPVNLPTSKSSTIVMQKVTVSITEDLKYYVNDRPVNRRDIENALRKELNGQEGNVSLHIDKSVPSENLVEIAGIATSLNAKVSVATKPN